MNEFKRVFPKPPSSWRKVKLSDFLARVTTRNDVRDHNVLTISAEHGLISQLEFFSRRVASTDLRGYYRLMKGDFAYNKSYSKGYPVGAIRRLDRYASGVVSPLYICFRPMPDADNDSDFLAHYFDGGAVDRQLADVAKEGARNHGLLNVSVTDFFGIETALPMKTEQRMIAQVLDTLHDAIHATEAIIAKLKAIKRGLLHDLLTRGIDANGELRPPQSEAPHLYMQSPLGWIPKEWDIEVLGGLAESLIDGPFGSNLKTSHYVQDPGVRVVRLQNIQQGEYDDSERAFVSEKHAASLSRNRVTGGDVLIASLGDETYFAGRSCLYPKNLSDAVNKADCFRFRPNSRCLGEYIMLFMNGSAARKQVRAHEQGVTLKRINLSNVKRVLIAVPSVPEQHTISERIQSVQEQIEATLFLSRKLRNMRSGLMDDLLTGRVPVTPLLPQAQNHEVERLADGMGA